MNRAAPARNRGNRAAPARGRGAGARRPVRRLPEASYSTETAIEIDELEQPARDRLSACFHAKRRLIHPEQPQKKIFSEEPSLENERVTREKQLVAQFNIFMGESPSEHDPLKQKWLLNGLMDWLERLEVEQMAVDNALVELEKKSKVEDVLETTKKLSELVEHLLKL